MKMEALLGDMGHTWMIYIFITCPDSGYICEIKN